MQTGELGYLKNIEFVFLDRDGVLNRKPAAGKFVTCWIVALAGIAAVLGVWLSVRLGTFHAVFRNYAVEWGFLAYIGWALVQQFILQDFILARLLQITPKRTLAVIVAGLLFAVAHVPNPLLVIATIVWGVVACALFLRYRNLYVLGLAHAILGMCIAVAVPNQWHHHMRVGLGYLRWHHPSTAHKQQIPHSVRADHFLVRTKSAQPRTSTPQQY